MRIVPLQPDSYEVLCPMCRIPRDAAHISMRLQGKWNSIKCKGCKKQRSSRQWLCSCHVPWHSCPQHAISGHACGSKEKAIREAKPHSTARLSMSSSSGDSRQPCIPIVGTGGVFRKGRPRLKNNRKRKFSRQPLHVNRRRLSLETGIPSSFLLASLAERFGTHVRNVPDILPNPDLRRGADLT